jgi:uncharacterized protein with von Willebrand factor type A (vWA) domain
MIDAMQGVVDEPALDLPENADLFDALPPLFVPWAIDDGSQVIRHDGYDVESWDAAVRDYGKLREAVEGASTRLITALPLFRDVFWSFYKQSPTIGPIVALTPAHAINRQIVEQILGTTEWRQTRAAGTSGDPIASAMATLGVAYSAIQALDAATVADVNRLHELESGAAALFAQATALTDLAEQAEGDRARDLFEQAERARTEAERQQTELEQAAAALATEDEAREEALRRAARSGLTRAMGEIAEEAEAVRVFGGGYGGGGGGAQQFTAKDRIALAQMVQGSRRLKQMMAIAGRQITIALDVQATKVPYPPTEVAGITFGNDPALVLPSELALLMLPQTKLLFYKGMAERSLMQWELIGRRPQGQGPVIVAVDESGSMSGPCGPYPKTVWAGGTLLAFLAIARLQKRDLVVLHFAEQGQLRVDVFPGGEGPYQETLRCAEHFYNGGDTRFEPWMRKATDLVQTSQPKADVIVLTDGLTTIDRTVLGEFNAARKAMEMRSYGVLIGTTQGMRELSLCSDAVLTLDDLSQDLPILNDIFAI